MSKNSFKIMAEAINSAGGLKNLKLSTSRVNHRRLTVDEIKEHLMEEFGKAKAAADEEVQEPEKGWSDAELVNDIEWVKALNLEEAFNVKKDK